MANNSPTIVAASLSDDQLKKSIDSLVTHVDEAMKKMVQSTNNAVGEMEAKLKSLGNLKIDSGGSADGGASKRTKAQNAETDAVEKSIAARDKQIKKNQDVATSFDQMAKAQQVAIRSASPSGIRNADTLQTMNIQLDLLRERLREARQQYSSFVALAAHATTTGDKGLFQYATDGVHRYEQEVRNLIPQIRTLQSGIQQMGDVIAPQGHTIQNYVNSLQKANPELAALNAQYKSGTSLLQDQSTSYASAAQSAQRYTEEIRKQAQAIRESRQWKETGTYSYQIGDATYYVSKKQGEIEAQLVRHKEQQVNYQKDYLTAGMAVEQNTKQQASAEEKLVQAEQQRLGIEQQITQEKEKQKKKYTSPTSNEWVYNQTLYNNFVKSRLGGKTPVSWKENTSDINTLNAALSQLRKVYSSLTSEERAHPYGQSTLDQIQRLERRLNVLRSEMSRPLSFNAAMGLPEKTLDDIAYKMRQLASYRSGLNVETQVKEIEQVNKKYAQLQKNMNDIMQKNTNMIASNTALGRSWNYMKNRLAFYVTVGAGTSFIKNLIEVRSQYEMNEKALGILLDSASRGTRIFNELSQMALVSPYTLIELSNAAKQLTAYDIAAKDVVDTTRRLADMASAVGVPVERLTYALGQIKAYGYLNSRDARMFANAGIPLVKQLADRYSELEGKMVSTADVYDRMKKKAIDYNDVMAVINKMTDEGGKFFDFQAKMAETLKVRLANLTLAWNNMLNDMGKDNQGVMTTGLKGLTVMFKHWRELYRIISTAITALGAYKVATIIAGMATKTSIGGSAVASWFALARGVKGAKDAVALFSLTLKSIPFTAWFTAIATLASYFILFNNSSDDVKQKLEDIKSAFDGVRKEVETLFADAIKTGNIGTQLTKLRDMLELAETELGVTIPIRLEDVNESNIKQKLKEAKQFVDEYINFSQTFSEAAAGTKFNELMNDFGSKARSTYTNVTESINSVVVALQELSDKGQASKRDIEILNELTSGQKEDESRIEYLQRLVSLYEELGLIGQKKVTPKISFFGSSEDNIEELEQQQENALDRLDIKNKSVFENMLKDVQGYYSSSSIAAYQFEQQVMRVAEKIDINNIPVEQRTMKLTAAINEEASQNNWNQFEKEFARQIANKKFGTTIEISDESKKAAEEDLQAWQRNIQNWAKNNGITFDVSFQTNDTEASYAKRMLQEAKDAKELWETLGRKEKQGTGSKDATTKAYKDYIERRKLAAAAGADLSSLDAKSRKAASKAESELAKALKDELSTIDKVRSIYKDLTKEGMSHANAVERATRGWDETVNAINRVLQKNGLQKLDLSKFAGIENPRELVNMLQSQLNTLLKRGAKPADIKELQTKIQTLNVDAEKYDLTKITKGLNNELGKLKDEYELAVELDANPELGGMFADMLGIDTSTMSHSIDEYMDNVRMAVDKARMGLGYGVGIDIFGASEDEWQRWAEWVGISNEKMQEFRAMFEPARSVVKKWATDTVNNTKKLEYELAELNDKIAIKEKEQGQLHEKIEKEKNEVTKYYLQLTYQSNEKAIDELRAQALSLMPEYARVFNSIAEYSAGVSRRLQRDLMRVFDEAKYDSANKKWTLTGSDGKQTILNDTQYRKEREKLTKEMRKSQAPFKKIKEAFKPSDKNGVVDYAKGIELLGGEIGKVGGIVSSIGDFAEKMGFSRETVEIINDVATSLNGVSTMAQGIGQIASGDYIGGAASVLSGLTTAVSTWFDNADNKITDQIKDSELAVKRLENTYKNLSAAIEDAYGSYAIGAKQAAIANKELQLVELQRQLALEESRDSKNRDEDRIVALKGEIIDLRNEIRKSYQEITTDLLGISSVGSAAEEFMEQYIQALRKGEDAQAAFSGSFKEMIANMIKQLFVTKVIGPQLEALVDEMNERITNRSKAEADAYQKAVQKQTELETMDFGSIRDMLRADSDSLKKFIASETDDKEIQNDAYIWARAFGGDNIKAEWVEQYRKYLIEMAEKEVKDAQKELNAATIPTIEDMDIVAQAGKDLMPLLQATDDELKDLLERYDLYDKDSENKLSALQQGISQISESTAESLEAYMNGVSQQVYLHSDLLTQIRDAVVGFDMDVQLGVFSQMLLQLQQSYTVQMSIESILQGVLNPSGRAFSVELVS